LVRVVARHTWDRAKLFLQKAGTVILGINILLWFLAAYPKNSHYEQHLDARRMTLLQSVQLPVRSVAELPKALTAFAARQHTPGGYNPPEARVAAELGLLDKEQAGERLRNSFAGRLGRAIEPIIAPLGFDWKIGIGIVSSFAAREVFVSTMSLVYNVGQYDKSEAGLRTLAQTLHAQRRPDGTLFYTPLQGITLMVFYVLALQCVSTLAVMRKETASWKWPCFQWLYMGALAWLFAFITYQGGRWLGLG
jgi:ferrous iron transport protein B